MKLYRSTFKRASKNASFFSHLHRLITCMPFAFSAASKLSKTLNLVYQFALSLLMFDKYIVHRI